VQKPTLVIAHNKTLAAQLASEFKSFFPENYVGYFVSYYDYYQPEAYIASTDTYIEKDSSINDEIDELRHSATCSLFERRDVIIVASVSCIYGLGSPESYHEMVLSLHKGQEVPRDDILHKLVQMRYERNDIAFERGRFRVRGDVVEVFPAGYNNRAVRIELFGDEIDRMVEYDVVTGEVYGERTHLMVFPASHYVTEDEDMKIAMQDIRNELDEQLKMFRENGLLPYRQNIFQFKLQRQNFICQIYTICSSFCKETSQGYGKRAAALRQRPLVFLWVCLIAAAGLRPRRSRWCRWDRS
jgi:excinuclease ABC subunit B